MVDSGSQAWTVNVGAQQHGQRGSMSTCATCTILVPTKNMDSISRKYPRLLLEDPTGAVLHTRISSCTSLAEFPTIIRVNLIISDPPESWVHDMTTSSVRRKLGPCKYSYSALLSTWVSRSFRWESLPAMLRNWGR